MKILKSVLWVRVLDCESWLEPGDGSYQSSRLPLPPKRHWELDVEKTEQQGALRTVSDHVQKPERKDAVTMMGYYCRLHEKCPHKIRHCTWSPVGGAVQGSYRMLGPAGVHCWVGLQGSVASPTSCSISLLPVCGKGY